MKKIFVLIVLLIFMGTGCEEIEIPILNDDDEIARYIADSDDARQLFTTENLILSVPYTYPLDVGASYVDLVDSVKRTLVTYIAADAIGGSYAAPAQYFGPPFGTTKDAEVTVTDKFFISTLRISGTDTTVIPNVRNLNRYAYFIKIGDDGDAFSGWFLWAYNGGAPHPYTRVEITKNSGGMFRGDTLLNTTFNSILLDVSTNPPDTIQSSLNSLTAYLLLSGSGEQIERLDPSEKLDIKVVRRLGSVRFYTLSAASYSGHQLGTLYPDNTELLDTLVIPPNLSNTWNLIYMQEFRQNDNDTSSVPQFKDLLYRSWCVPYRAN